MRCSLWKQQSTMSGVSVVGPRQIVAEEKVATKSCPQDRLWLDFRTQKLTHSCKATPISTANAVNPG